MSLTIKDLVEQAKEEPFNENDREKITIPLATKEETFNIYKTVPTEKRIKLMSEAISDSIEENFKYFNPYRLKVYYCLNVISYYTDIPLSLEDWQNAVKTYDLLEKNKIFSIVFQKIDQDERAENSNFLQFLIKELNRYNYSIQGLLNNIRNNYDNLNFDLDSIRDKLKDENVLNLLKEIKDYNNN